MKSIASLLLGLLLFTNVAHAQSGNKGYCQKAETTADLVECITIHQKAEDEITQNLFQHLETIAPEKIEGLKTNHGDWIIYRENTCVIQGDAYEGGSLQRVEELNCRAKMTSDRNQTLQNIIVTHDESYIPEYSNPPRWVNVLVRDYPNMFWNLGNADAIDTDCDGVTENIVRGVDGDQKMTLAIADSEQTGRPKITVINFDDLQNCKILAGITLEKFPEPKPTEDAPLACMQSLKIQTKSCGEFAIHYNPTDKIYSLKK